MSATRPMSALEARDALLGLGLAVFPLHPRSKKPATSYGFKDATNDHRKARALWMDAAMRCRCPPDQLGIGLPMDANRLMALDIDPRNTDRPLAETLAWLANEFGPETLDTVRQITGGGGAHLGYQRAPGQLKNCVLRPGIEVKVNGYIVVAPSIHPNGQRYGWDTGRSPFERGFAPMPSRLVEAITAGRGQVKPAPTARPTPAGDGDNAAVSAYARAAFDAEIAKVRQAKEGARNNTLNEAAFALSQLVRAGLLASDRVTAALAQAAADAGLGAAEVERTIASGLAAGMASPRDLSGVRASVHGVAARAGGGVGARSDDARDGAAEAGTAGGNGTAGREYEDGDDHGARQEDEQAGTGSANEPPLPLIRETTPPDKFPIDALSGVLGDAAAGIHDRVQAPMAICAQSVLAAADLAVQAHADVQLPTGRARPLSIYYTTVAASGERKSACDSEALWPIRKHETALRARYDQELPRYENDRAAWDAQRRQILNEKKQPSREAKKRALDELGPAPSAPLIPMLTCPEPTFEGLCRLLVGGHPSVGLFSDEGGQFIGGFAMSDDHRLKTAAAMSGLWDGEPIRRVRASDGATILTGRRVALHLMMQPEVSAGLLSDRLLADQGLLSRLLVTAPPSAVGSRMSHVKAPDSDAAIKRYGAKLLAILETPLPLAEGKHNGLAPRRMPLSAAAQHRWSQYADHIERAMAAGGPLEPVRGLANKLPEHAARLAAVLALVNDLSAGEVESPHLEAGIALADHYAAEALRLFNAGRVAPDLTLACRLFDWLHNGWRDSAISLPDIYQLGPNAIRDAQTARRIVNILVEHRWLRRTQEPTTVRGVKRREAWWIMGRLS